MIISVIIFILTLLVLVLIHEFGHFLVAKRFGIKVEEFGFGIPPRIFGKKFGETLYSINVLPLGGFVRLLGEDSEDKVKNERDFRAKGVGQRIAVVVAGVLMNLLLAWVIFYSVIIYQNFKIIYPTMEPAVYVGYLEKDYPAEKAGISFGDKILKVNGKDVRGFDDFKDSINKSNGQPVDITLSNYDGRDIKTLKVTPKRVDEKYLVGIGFSPIAIRLYKTLPDKLFSGITYSFDLIKLTFLGLGKTIQDLYLGRLQQVSSSVSGPVGLANISNDILSGGRQALPFYFWFVGVISLTLSIFNVLPIPALDGGRLLFLVIEAVFKKKVREDVERWVHQIGFAILLLLALLVTYSDISKLIYK